MLKLDPPRAQVHLPTYFSARATYEDRLQYNKYQPQKHAPRRRKKKKRGGYRVHRVSYTAQNHVQVLFRRYASAFPRVLPFAAANTAWTLCIFGLKWRDAADLTFHSSVGHSFMGLLVSFLIVSRSKISYDRFMEYRRHLAESYRACVSAGARGWTAAQRGERGASFATPPFLIRPFLLVS